MERVALLDAIKRALDIWYRLERDRGWTPEFVGNLARMRQVRKQIIVAKGQLIHFCRRVRTEFTNKKKSVGRVEGNLLSASIKCVLSLDGYVW